MQIRTANKKIHAQALEQKLKPLGLRVRLATGALEGEERAIFFQQVDPMLPVA